MSCSHRAIDHPYGSCYDCDRIERLYRKYGERKADLERLTDADWAWIQSIQDKAKQEIENERRLHQLDGISDECGLRAVAQKNQRQA